MSSKKEIAWNISKGILAFLWKLFLMLLLVAGKVVVAVISVLNDRIASHLQMNIHKKKLN